MLMVHVGPEGVMGTDFNWASGDPFSIRRKRGGGEDKIKDGIRDLSGSTCGGC